MLDTLYFFMTQLGYLHPLHPALTHAPIGGVMLACCLVLAGIFFKRSAWLQAAHYLTVVTCLAVLPTVLLGWMDWQHYYAGAWLTIFKLKMNLAAGLFVLLAITAWISRNLPNRAGWTMLLLSGALLIVGRLGYLGGTLVYANQKSAAPVATQRGEKLFKQYCVGCHLHGENVLEPSLPLRTSPKLNRYADFVKFIRQPVLRNGLQGPMPAFDKSKLSEQDAQALYNYVSTQWRNQK